jgi:hypothetical protein
LALKSSAFKPRKKNAPRPDWKVAEAFKQWLRGRPCACGGRNPACDGKIQAAHGPHKASKGMATKAADRYCMPLSEGCHLTTQHKQGWQTFAARYLGGADPLAICEEYWRAWPGRSKWELNR